MTINDYETLVGCPAILEGLWKNVPPDKYHREGAGLSRSMAQTLVFQSPLHMRWEQDNPKDETKAMRLGSLVHLACLDPAKLKGSYYVRPETYPNNGDEKPWHHSALWCRQWLTDHSDRPVVTVDDEMLMLGCVLSLHTHPLVRSLISCGHAEVSAFSRHDNIRLRARPDLIATDDEGRIWVLDIKKCQDASTDGFTRHARTYRLPFQQSWYRYVLSLIGIEVFQFLFVAVEEKPPHGVAVFKLDPMIVDSQNEAVHMAIDIYTQCIESGKWPGYDETTRMISWRTGT